MVHLPQNAERFDGIMLRINTRVAVALVVHITLVRAGQYKFCVCPALVYLHGSHLSLTLELESRVYWLGRLPTWYGAVNTSLQPAAACNRPQLLYAVFQVQQDSPFRNRI